MAIHSQPFTLDTLDQYVKDVSEPEEIRDVTVHIYDEMEMRKTGSRSGQTGFEAMSDYDLRLSFYRTVNELVHRGHQ